MKRRSKIRSISVRYLILVLVLCSLHAHAQLTDLARLEYSFIPASRSEDQYTRLRAVLNYPIKLKKEGSYLVVGAEYNRIIINLNEPYPFDTSLIDLLHVIDLNIGYTFKLDDHWRLGIQFNPRIASTLNGGLTGDDFFLNGGVFAICDRSEVPDVKRPYRLILGLTYNATLGVPIPLPFVSYYRRVSEHWSYTAGVPKSNVKYLFSDKFMMQGFALLDGYYANLSQPINFDGRSADHISLSVAVAGLGFEYFLTDHLVIYTYSGYTFRLNSVFRNDNRDEVFRLDNLNAFYLRTGIKFKI